MASGTFRFERRPSADLEQIKKDVLTKLVESYDVYRKPEPSPRYGTDGRRIPFLPQWPYGANERELEMLVLAIESKSGITFDRTGFTPRPHLQALIGNIMSLGDVALAPYETKAVAHAPAARESKDEEKIVSTRDQVTQYINSAKPKQIGRPEQVWNLITGIFTSGASLFAQSFAQSLLPPPPDKWPFNLNDTQEVAFRTLLTRDLRLNWHEVSESSLSDLTVIIGHALDRHDPLPKRGPGSR